MALDCSRSAFTGHDGCEGMQVPDFPDFGGCELVGPHGITPVGSLKAPAVLNPIPQPTILPVDLPDFICAVPDEIDTSVSFIGNTGSDAGNSSITIRKADEACEIESIDLKLDLPTPETTVRFVSYGVDMSTGEDVRYLDTEILGDETLSSLPFTIVLTMKTGFSISVI